MRLRSAAIALLLGLATSAAAIAGPCSTFLPSAQTPFATANDVPLASGIGDQRMFPCSNQGAPQSIGDLTPQGQQQSVQWCESNCAYTPLFPDDSQSPMLPVRCWAPGSMPNVAAFAPMPLLVAAPGLPRLGSAGACTQAAGPVRIPQRFRVAPIDLPASRFPVAPRRLPAPPQ